MQTTNAFSEDELELPALEAQFSVQRKEAEEWYAALRQKELDWIKSGANVDAEFDKLYRDEPQVQSGSLAGSEMICLIAGVLALMVAGGTVGWLRRKSVGRKKTGE